MLRQLSAAALCLLLILLNGCGPSSKVKLDSNSISSAEVREIVRKHHANIRSMKGEGRISVESPEMAESCTFVLALQKPDSVLINLQGPFGIKVGLALVTRNGFLFYNSLENKLVTGSSSIENLYRILHVELSFNDLLNLFAGGIFVEDDQRSPDIVCIEDNQYIFIFKGSNDTRKYWIDPVTFSIQKIQFIDRQGELSLEQVFSNFENIDGISMPHTIRVKQPVMRQMFSLSYSDILVNAEPLKFTFTIPDNAERIHW